MYGYLKVSETGLLKTSDTGYLIVSGEAPTLAIHSIRILFDDEDHGGRVRENDD